MLCAGALSGTSINAKEFILCNINGEEIKVIKYQAFNFHRKEKEKLIYLVQNKGGNFDEILLCNEIVGLSFAKSLKKFLDGVEIKPEVVGFHGQTIYHYESKNRVLTYQIGEPLYIAMVSGVPVVYDFRKSDIVAGGKGAPLSPIAHKILFGKISRKVLVVNLGGIANVTYIKDGEVISAKDVGPANALSDFISKKRFGVDYDKFGKRASEGDLIEPAFEKALNFIRKMRKGKKTLGYEIEEAKKFFFELTKNENPSDALRTAVEISVKLISEEVNFFRPDICILCGGGTKNKFMVSRLKEEIKNTTVVISDEVGVNSDFVEPILFAYFAYLRINGVKVDMSKITGAKISYLPGKICSI
jgi:anhydro-N-acetylmuramic acid kinase